MDDDLIVLLERLRDFEGNAELDRDAADELEAQAQRITELEWQRDNNIRGCQCSDDEACAHVRRAEKAEAHLGNLLAMLHRDGGHYQGEHGTDNAVGEATMAWSVLILRAEKAEADLAAARKAVVWLMYVSANENVETWADYPDHAAAIAAARGEQPLAEYLDTNGAALAALIAREKTDGHA